MEEDDTMASSHHEGERGEEKREEQKTAEEWKGEGRRKKGRKWRGTGKGRIGERRGADILKDLPLVTYFPQLSHIS